MYNDKGCQYVIATETIYKKQSPFSKDLDTMIAETDNNNEAFTTITTTTKIN